MSIVVLCEKKSQADSMKAALGLQRQGAWYGGSLGGRAFTVVWAAGHLFELAEPDAAMPGISWNDLDTLLPLPPTVKMSIKPSARDLYAKIKEAVLASQEVWISTDPDREGEAIGRSILSAARFNGTVRRLWLTGGMDPVSVTKAFEDVKPGAFSAPMYSAQQARALTDWQSQVLTRAMTIAGRRGALGEHLGVGSGGAGVVSVGRVQSATVMIVANRDGAIKRFKPTAFFTPWIEVSQGGRSVKLEYHMPKIEPGTDVPGGIWVESEDGETEKLRITDPARIETFTRSIGPFKGQSVELAFTSKTIFKKPPSVHSLTTLQATMSRKAKLSATTTLEALSALYLAGYVSYPRTEREKLPTSEWGAAPDVLRAISAVEGLAPAAQAPAARDPAAPPPDCYTDEEMEHHGLMPTVQAPTLSALTAEMKAVYLEVAQRYILAHYPPAEFQKAAVSARIPVTGLLGEPTSLFATIGERCVNPGHLGLFDQKIKDTLPELTAGPATVAGVGANEGSTRPPPHYTESTLLLAMRDAGKFASSKAAEKQLKAAKGIGTPATRNVVIDTILERGYLESRKIGGEKFLLITPKGEDLVVHAPGNLVSVDLTAELETELAEIEKLTVAEAISRRDAFIARSIELNTRIIEELKVKVAKTPPRASHQKPSEKMLWLAQKVAKDKGIPLPPEAAAQFEACKAFLDAHAGDRPSAPRGDGVAAPRSSGPSEKMLGLATKLAADKKVKMPDAVKTDFKACKAFIDKHIGGKR